MNYAIVNAKIVNEGTVADGDIGIVDGRIAPVPRGKHTVIDANGAWLLPGMIDDQVHFREPGFEHKGCIATESRAAVAGGITSYMEMPNCNPLTATPDALRDKHTRAANSSLANFGFYFGATNDNLEFIKSVDTSLACGVKVFMGASTGNMLVDNPKTLEGIFASSPLLIATHCEDTPMILANEAKARQKWGENVPMAEHANIRSADVCYASSSLAISLARKHNARLHVLHLTTAKEMSLFEVGDLQDKKITAEACVHHLFFNSDDYADKGALIKCNPAIKTADDQRAIIQAVKDDRIDVIATDHAPHTSEEKARTYFSAPAGLPLVQHALLSLIEHVHSDTFDINTIVNKTAHAPARLFDVKNRGFIREGYWADLVLVNPDSPTKVADQELYAKCGWSPFADTTFQSAIEATFVNGILAYHQGKIMSEQFGLPLEFER